MVISLHSTRFRKDMTALIIVWLLLTIRLSGEQDNFIGRYCNKINVDENGFRLFDDELLRIIAYIAVVLFALVSFI